MLALPFPDNAAGPPKVLRPHQESALAALRASLGKGNRKVVLQGATGFGKTLVAARITLGALAKGNRVVFAVPMVALVDQTVRAFRDEGIPHVGVLQADHALTDPTAPVQVASIQTLARRKAPPASVVIWDECHVRSRAMERLMEDSHAVFVGLSATPWAKGMGHVWDDLVIAATVADLIRDGYLSRFEAYAPHVPDLEGIAVRSGEFVEAELEKVMGGATIVADVTQTWLARAAGRPTLAFGCSRAHARAMQADFRRAGVCAEYLDGFTDTVERTLIKERFCAGEASIICSVRTMTTGVDLPVSCIIDAAPTRSEILHVQRIGRGLRINPGTEDCLILDHAGNSFRLGLVTDISHDQLDAGRKGEAKGPVSAQKLPRECACCGLLFTGMICPSCGTERQAPRGPVAAEGELRRITGAEKLATRADKQRFVNRHPIVTPYRHPILTPLVVSWPGGA